ncbi:hypothetical protein CYA84_04270 [Campylobacter coli]|nr:hypothetical protein [Campylobacter coli]
MLKDKRIKKYCEKVINTTKGIGSDRLNYDGKKYAFDNLYILYAFTKIFKIELSAYPTQKLDGFVYVTPAYDESIQQETAVSFKDFLFNRFNLNNIDKLPDLYQKSMFRYKNYYKLSTVEHHRGLIIAGWVVSHQMMGDILSVAPSSDAIDD